MTTPRSAAIYARISSDQTGEGLGVARQLEDCRKLAADRGWIVGDEYVDNDVSAFKSRRRPEYERMLADLEAGDRDAVIVYNMDRLTRQPMQLEQFVSLCERAGVQQVATVTSDINLGNEDGMFTARVLAAVAAQESARKSARIKRKALQLAEQGMPHGGSNRPFGYEEDRITIRESEAAIIRQLAARFLAGESFRSLCWWLDSEGVQTVRGGGWRTPSLKQMLISARIAGLREHNGSIVADAVWEPIITPEQRLQILGKLASRKVSGRRTPRRYVLSGMLRCGRCGNTLYSASREANRRYVCLSGPDHGGCGRLTVVAPPVEVWISAAVLHRLDTPEMGDLLAGRRAADERHDVLIADLDADKAQMEDLARMWSRREISAAEWKAAREPIEARIHSTNRQLEQLQGSNVLDGLVGAGAELRAKWEELNLDRQAAIIGAVLDFATILPGTPGARVLDPTRVVPTWRL